MPLGGLIADRFNRKTFVIVGNFLFAVFLAAVPFTVNFGQLLIVLLIQGISTALCLPSASALVVEEGRKFGMGSTMSLFFLALAIGLTIGPILSGGIAEWLNIDMVFYVCAGIVIAGTALFFWFTRGYHGSRLNRSQT